MLLVSPPLARCSTLVETLLPRNSDAVGAPFRKHLHAVDHAPEDPSDFTGRAATDSSLGMKQPRRGKIPRTMIGTRCVPRLTDKGYRQCRVAPHDPHRSSDSRLVSHPKSRGEPSSGVAVFIRHVVGWRPTRGTRGNDCRPLASSATTTAV